jgi:hypothetical protein
VEAAVVLAVLAIGGLIAFAGWYASESQTTLRRLRATPQLPIGQVPEGTEVRIRGRVEPLSPPGVAPLSGRACVFYEVIIEELRGGKNKRWVRLVRDVQGVPFAVVDDTGRAIVDASGAKLALHHDVTTRSGTLDDADAREQALLARHGISSTGWVFNKTIRYLEAVLEPGETVVVAGQGVREPDPDAVAQVAGYREGLPTRLRLTSSATFPLYVSDRAGDV